MVAGKINIFGLKIIYNTMKYLKTFLENNNSLEYLINSNEFKKWFVNSKIVDENNKPIIMYHGSSNKFDTFDINSETNERTNNFAGFYFTPDKNYAERFSKNIYSCFLRIINPLHTYRHKPSEKAIDYIYNKYKDKYDERYIDGKLYDLRDGRWWASFMNGDDSRQMAIIDGFDGYIDGTDVCAFYPNQIKLADGSNTTFNLNDDSIKR